MNNVRIALAIFSLLAFSGCWVAGFALAGSADGGRATADTSNSAMTLKVGLTSDYEIGSEYIGFAYDVHNIGTAKLCDIVINNSLTGMAPLDPFDLEPGENSTFTVEYHITAEDRESPYLVNEVMAAAHSCKTGQVTTKVIASYSVVLIQPS